MSHIRYFDKNSDYSRHTSKTVLVGGCFDILHYGHLDFLISAKKYADYLMIALEPDEKIFFNKKRAPIHTVQQRAEILAALRVVNEVIILPVLHTYADYLDLVVTVNPHYLAITKGDPHHDNKQKMAAVIGGELIVVNSTIEMLSSSKIILSAIDN